MKIAVAGYGVEGKANLEYFRGKGEVTIVDERDIIYDVPGDVPTITGAGAFSQLTDFDLVVRTAGLAPDKIITNGKIWSATNEFFEKCPAKIIGVTGTKGKGTTSSFIASILHSAGYRVHLVGNIGTPALDVLPSIRPDDIVVYELSSFQLWDLEKSPHVAVVLMVEPDHLDVHADMDEYVRAKKNIRRFQTPLDVCWFHPDNKISREIAESGSSGRAAPFNTPGVGGSVYIQGNAFCVNDQEICPTNTVLLPGKHNLENAAAAMSAVLTVAPDARTHISAALRSFTGLPHRLKFVRDVQGVRYYDDSISTTPGSALAAIRSFDQPKVMLLGGRSKGSSYEEVIDECHRTGTKIVAFGESGPEIARLAKSRGIIHALVKSGRSMSSIVKEAHNIADAGDVVILSPAGSSFDMYENYQQRGDAYVAAINNEL